MKIREQPQQLNGFTFDFFAMKGEGESWDWQRNHEKTDQI